MKFKLLGLFIFCFFYFADNSLAEHPINVQKNALNKEYYKAMICFERLPKQKINKEVLLSAAQSAWALSLPETATDLFDKMLNDLDLSSDEKSRIYLFKGIIEYQEERYPTAKIYAEKSLNFAKDDKLTSPSYKLLGDALFKLKQYAKAKVQYKQALKYASKEETSNINFQLGITYFYLGDFKHSKETLAKVPLYNEDASFGVRLLIKMALEEKDYTMLKKWLRVAENEFPDQFIDSYIDYAKVKLAVYEKNKDDAKKVIEKAKEKFPESDPWINLALATYETFLWMEGIKYDK